MSMVPPVIVVPGITATYLRDQYALPPEIVWSVLTHDYNKISLHPDSIEPNKISYEASEPSRLQPDQIFEIAYKELLQELRYNLRPKEDLPVPVFPFAYDWRQPLSIIEDQLALFIDEVIERTKLMRHYYDDGYAENPKVNLVGHSMGGLVITGYLDRYGKDKLVTKVVTLATPFRGSFEAVIKLSTGTANLGNQAPSSREREAARITPALYHLIPSCPWLEVDPGLPTSLFDPALWQPSILQTLEEYIRLHAVSKKDRKQQAKTLFSALLDASKIHRDRIEGFKLNKAGLKPNDWLCVVGVDSLTRTRLQIVSTSRGINFEFRSKDRENNWKEKDPSARRLTGDGTVPFEGALPSFLKEENLVCVTPEDFGYWEIQDKLTTSIAGFHGILPNMDMLHRLIVRHFTNKADSHGNTWGRSAPGVSAWQPPIALKQR